jgi:hypothetical protein
MRHSLAPAYLLRPEQEDLGLQALGSGSSELKTRRRTLQVVADSTGVPPEVEGLLDLTAYGDGDDQNLQKIDATLPHNIARQPERSMN